MRTMQIRQKQSGPPSRGIRETQNGGPRRIAPAGGQATTQHPHISPSEGCRKAVYCARSHIKLLINCVTV